jgi:hypothetical protein
MPKAKKHMKLRDQKPLKDPKGGVRGHHRHARVGGASGSREDRERVTGGMLP